jgi:hypothetical protein
VNRVHARRVHHPAGQLSRQLPPPQSGAEEVDVPSRRVPFATLAGQEVSGYQMLTALPHSPHHFIRNSLPLPPAATRS